MADSDKHVSLVRLDINYLWCREFLVHDPEADVMQVFEIAFDSLLNDVFTPHEKCLGLKLISHKIMQIL